MADMAAHSAQSARGSRINSKTWSSSARPDSLGMWVFLVTEIMFFGGLFATYIVYRSLYLPAFEIGSRLLKVEFRRHQHRRADRQQLDHGSGHPCRADRQEEKSEQIMFLVLTMVLGVLFLFLKFNFEWRADYTEHLIPGFGFIIRPEWGAAGSHVPMFFLLLFFMTGLHALHMIIGFGILIVSMFMAGRNRFNSEYYAPLEVSGLYWHFVDIVWIFLFPLLYLDRWTLRHRRRPLMSEHIVPVKTYLGIFVALLCLTALTTGAACISDLGAECESPIGGALAIAVAKVLLVILFFMHVKYSSGLTKIVVIVAGFFFLAILVSLTLADELTRGWTPNPGPWGAILPIFRGLL